MMSGSKSATLSFYEVKPDWNSVTVTPGKYTMQDIKRLMHSPLAPSGEDKSASIPTLPPPAPKKEEQKTERAILPGSKVWYIAKPSDVRSLFNNQSSEPVTAPASPDKEKTDKEIIENMEQLRKELKALRELEGRKKSAETK